MAERYYREDFALLTRCPVARTHKNTALAVFFVFAFSPAEIDNAAPLCYAKRKILTEGDYAKKRENP